MTDPRTIYNQIYSLTGSIIATGLCDDQNYPSMKSHPQGRVDISISDLDTTVYLKNVAYQEMYAELRALRAYNMKMIDGALLLMQYRFVNDKLLSHRLTFFPSPNLMAFQNEPLQYLEDEIFADIIGRQVVALPIRFDYDEAAAVTREHPVSHMTLGQYKDCRIPVSAGLTPSVFLAFILRNFYHTEQISYEEAIKPFYDGFPDSIVSEEEQLLHVRLPVWELR